MTMSPNVQEEKIDSAKDVKIHVRTWLPAANPRGVVVICHGVNSHGGQYGWTGAQFAAAGYAAIALDLRGRGLSEGERFFVEDIADYVADVANTIALAKSRHPGLPVFLLGHSAGGVVSATYVLDNQSELAGFICESFAFQVPAPGFALAAIKGISHVAPRLPVLKLKNEDFSRDPKAVRGPEQRSADRARGAAGDHRRGAGARGRAAARRVPSHHAASADHARHRRQGDRLSWQRVLPSRPSDPATRR